MNIFIIETPFIYIYYKIEVPIIIINPANKKPRYFAGLDVCPFMPWFLHQNRS
ncbi:uncharacterized protein METZ01_LOCUS334663, partial [marine metagenome]